MIEINPREIAATALMEIIKENAYNNMALKRILKQNGAMSQKDKAFVTEIVNGTLRNLYFIDYIINSVSNTKTEKMKPWILCVLRTAVYQLKFLDKVPQSAVCNEAVKLVKQKGFGKLSGFVNGVLRNIMREEINLPDEEKNPAQYLSVKYSFPLWLLKMWLHEYDYNFVKDLCIASNEAPKVTVYCNNLKTNINELKNKLKQKGIEVEDSKMHSDAIKLSKLSDLSKLESFQKGEFHVQDESSALAVKILDPKEREKVLDVCAAPGGKSILAAELMNNKGEISSRDVYEHKLELIEDNANRLGINIINTELKDALEIYEEDIEKFDKVIVDAPCTGFGIIRKKPDIKYNKSGNDIDALSSMQKEILKTSSNYVKKGGYLLYSTCTICKKENIKNVEWFLNNFDYELCDISNYLPDGMKIETAARGYIQLYPNVNGTDGFFIAKFRRRD